MDDDHPADISRPRRRGDRITSLWDRPMRRPLCAGAHGAEPIERQCLAVVGSIHAGWPRASVTSGHADSII